MDEFQSSVYSYIVTKWKLTFFIFRSAKMWWDYIYEIYIVIATE